MAITSVEVCLDAGVKSDNKSLESSSFSKTRLQKISSCGMKLSIRSTNQCWKKTDSKSPYLNGDNVHNELPIPIEKYFASRKSSFPLAVNIYKANSDEFKNAKASNRKPKKSVLTLPNDSALMSQQCTVSDMTDNEYFNPDRKKIKTRNPITRKQKPKYGYYDRNPIYSSHTNYLECSSTDIIETYADEKRGRKSKVNGETKQSDDKTNPHDVWTILRNINRFHFKPSPPISSDNLCAPKRRKGRKTRRNQRDVRVVETEEFAYITSSYDVMECKSPRSNSKSSSNDRITVIDKGRKFNNSDIICEVINNRFTKGNNLPKAALKPVCRSQNNKSITNNNRVSTKNYTKNGPPKQTRTLLALKSNQTKPRSSDCSDIEQNKLPNYTTFGSPFNHYDIRNQLSSGNITTAYSGSSKAGVSRETSNLKYTSERGQFSYDSGPSTDFDEKTLVEINKDLYSNKRQIPSSPQILRPKPAIPKLTQADIKRRISRMRFPIVVLGKDQVSSTIEIVNTDPIQFNGLKKHIWPFMQRWQRKVIKKNNTLISKTDSSLQSKIGNIEASAETSKPKKTNRGMVTQTPVHTDKVVAYEVKRKSSCETSESREAAVNTDHDIQMTPTPAHVFRDKMLKLFCNNSPPQILDKTTNSVPKTKYVIKIPQTREHSPMVRKPVKSRQESPRIPITTNTKLPLAANQSWAKTSWSSEFIDNVIKKIKTGVYYSHDSNKRTKRKRNVELKEAEIQTIAIESIGSDPVMHSISKVTIKKKSLGRINIPGFDDSKLPALEIKSLTCNEISVKHCVTNILVQFDIAITSDSFHNTKKSVFSLDSVGDNPKKFKCKCSIVNSMLPAEICSILPKMMTNLCLAEANIALQHPRITLDKPPTLLSTISEIHADAQEFLNPIPFLQHIQMTFILRSLLTGLYPPKVKSTREFKVPKFASHTKLGAEMLPKLSRCDSFDCEAYPTLPLINTLGKPQISNTQKGCSKSAANTCMALKVYSDSKHLLTPNKIFSLNVFIQSLSHLRKKVFNEGFKVLYHLSDNNMTINLTTINSEGLEDILKIDVKKFLSNVKNKNVLKAGGNVLNAQKESVDLAVLDTKRDSQAVNQTSKIRKKRYVKLYRKCRSSSNLIQEKNSTNLSKITNVDEFFQALGTTKQISSVFDKISHNKILSSIKEMGNWISEINPAQALLVLLLVNKKDTPELARFRPVLLQGIAVNRITRANELDMEIEVIEREQMNVTRVYEGINYLPSSVENQDTLLEELCWIAKTTASDYQRIFDDSSRRLLKSLLEKRKKLNPSYLRVMARYVGLGLLKTPQKK